mmetsp:Transcript_11220/g.18891  ORF Transcript_11220/g.18891 Transcript_11220/m.18891 type:complete len:125 (+) Transcript_11220:292-666(+)
MIQYQSEKKYRLRKIQRGESTKDRARPKSSTRFSSDIQFKITEKRLTDGYYAWLSSAWENRMLEKKESEYAAVRVFTSRKEIFEGVIAEAEAQLLSSVVKESKENQEKAKQNVRMTWKLLQKAS